MSSKGHDPYRGELEAARARIVSLEEALAKKRVDEDQDDDRELTLLIATRDAHRAKASAPLRRRMLLSGLVLAALTVAVPLATLEHPQLGRILITSAIVWLWVVGAAFWLRGFERLQAKALLKKTEASIADERRALARARKSELEVRSLREALGQSGPHVGAGRLRVATPDDSESEAEEDEAADGRVDFKASRTA